MTGITLQPDPGLFSPKVMMGIRNANLFALFGQEKHTGSADAPFFPTNGAELFVYAVGTDGGATGAPSGMGITGSSAGGWSTTLNGGVSAGATSITVASGAGITTGDIFQIDTNGSGASAEVHMAGTVSGTSIPLAGTETLTFAHLTGVTVKKVIAPFTHTILEGNTVQPFPSLTVEKNVGNYQSLQFPGCRVNKYDIKAQATDTEATMTADLIAQSVNILDSPTASSYVDELPFTFSEVTLTVGSTSLTVASNFSLSLDNGMKPNYTFNGNHNLKFLTPTTLAVTGQIDIVWYSYDDATYGFLKAFLPDINGTSNNPVAGVGSITFAMTHPSSDPLSPSDGVTITLPNCFLSKIGDEIKMEDVVMQTLSYTAYYNLGGVAPVYGTAQTGWADTVSGTLVNSKYLPY
jgi:hypothetical protein